MVRGTDEQQPSLFSERSIEARIPVDRPLRPMRRMVYPIQTELSPLVAVLYSTPGRPSPGYHAERDAALEMLGCLEPQPHRLTVGADKGYDEDTLTAGVRRLNITPHVAPNVHAGRKKSSVDTRTTQHAGYAAQPAHVPDHASRRTGLIQHQIRSVSATC